MLAGEHTYIKCYVAQCSLTIQIQSCGQTNHLPGQRLKSISGLISDRHAKMSEVKAAHLYGLYKPGHLAIYSAVAVVGEWKVERGVGGIPYRHGPNERLMNPSRTPGRHRDSWDSFTAPS